MDASISNQVELVLKRIFCMPITKSTFRQVQHSIFSLTNGNLEESNNLLDGLVTGQPKFSDSNFNEHIKKLSLQYSINILYAKDVFEKGEYLGLISSDIMTLSPDNIILNNIIRRVDGDEFQLITDIDGSFNIIHHFVSRLEEVMKLPENTRTKEHVFEVFTKINDLLSNWLKNNSDKLKK